MERYIRTEYPGYFRDRLTNCIINTNDDEYQRILALRKKSKEIQDLRSELSEIKKLVQQLVENR